MLIGSIKPLQAPYLKSFLFARRNEKSFSHTWISFQSTQEKPQKPVSGKSPLILIHLTFLFYRDSVPNPDTPCGLCVLHVFAVANTRTRPVVWWPVSIPLSPFSRGHIRASGLSIAARLPCPPTPARHLMMPCCSVAPFEQWPDSSNKVASVRTCRPRH